MARVRFIFSSVCLYTTKIFLMAPRLCPFLLFRRPPVAVVRAFATGQATTRRTLSSCWERSSSGVFHHTRRRIAGGNNINAVSAFQQSSRRRNSGSTTTTTATTAVRSSSSSSSSSNDDDSAFFASHEEYPDFAALGIQSPVLLDRLANMKSSNLNKLSRPTAVQAAAFGAIAAAASSSAQDVTVGAETGSGMYRVRVNSLGDLWL